MAESDRSTAHLYDPDHTQQSTDANAARGEGQASTGRWRFSSAVEAARHLGSAPR